MRQRPTLIERCQSLKAAAVCGVIVPMFALCADPARTMIDARASSNVGDANEAIVQTDVGPVRGTIAADHRSFQGIPFAAPPVEDLRWQPPQPVQSWSDVRDATGPGHPCPQLASELAGNEGSVDEDCLYLNVTTPMPRADGRSWPVLVWIHGGGFSTGQGSDYGARQMVVDGDVVDVTVNYRLGIFGFFGHPELGESSGTYGLQDQQAALRWVQRNIASFGGDPDNVTLAGQSAGGDSICAQLTSPAATGLFDRVVMQSGTCTRDNVTNAILPGVGPLADTWKPRSTVEGIGTQVATTLHCVDPATALACLRRVSVPDLLTASTAPDAPPVYWSPAFNSQTLPVHPAEALSSGKFNQVPMLAGITRDEGRYFVVLFFDGPGQPITSQLYQDLLDVASGDRAAQVAARYPLSAYDSPSQAWAAVITDRAFACPNLRNAHQAAAWIPTYVYQFADREAPVIVPAQVSWPLGAYHASELASLFDLARKQVSLTPEQEQLSDQMIQYWTRFARTGDPNGPDLPQWKRFESGNANAQSLAPGPGGIRPVDLGTEHQCDLWENIP